MNFLSEKAINYLMTKEQEYQVIYSDSMLDDNNRTMLKLLFLCAFSDNHVSISVLKDQLNECTLKTFSDDVITMLTHMKELYDDILNNKGENPDFIHDLFCLLHTFGNASFQAYIDRLKDD